MRLLIDRKYPQNFVEQIRIKLIRDVLFELPYKDFTKIDVEMNNAFQLPEVILSKDVITYALDNLVIRKNSTTYSIEFDPVINYPKTKIKLITLIQFISFGNFNVHGSSILTDEFEKLNINLTKMYKIYTFRGVVL